VIKDVEEQVAKVRENLKIARPDPGRVPAGTPHWALEAKGPTPNM
jgi:hypothetical protein